MSTPIVLITEDLGLPRATVEAAIDEALGATCCFETVSDAEAAAVTYVVTVKTAVDEALLEQLPNLKAVAVAFTGYDAVDLDACRARGVNVMNVPHYATAAVAELVIGLALSCLREIPQAQQTVAAGGWLCKAGDELRGKTVGIVGTGAIGVATAELFTAFGCQVIGWSRSRNEAFAAVGTYVDELSEVLAQADIASLHVPLTDKTRGLLGAAELATMKPAALLINTARGPVIDEVALLTALDAGTIRGAALDVFATEPLPADHPLRTHPRVLSVPHISFNTVPALEERLRVTVANLAAVEAGSPVHVVS